LSYANISSIPERPKYIFNIGKGYFRFNSQITELIITAVNQVNNYKLNKAQVSLNLPNYTNKLILSMVLYSFFEAYTATNQNDLQKLTLSTYYISNKWRNNCLLGCWIIAPYLIYDNANSNLTSLIEVPNTITIKNFNDLMRSIYEATRDAYTQFELFKDEVFSYAHGSTNKYPPDLKLLLKRLCNKLLTYNVTDDPREIMNDSIEDILGLSISYSTRHTGLLVLTKVSNIDKSTASLYTYLKNWLNNKCSLTINNESVNGQTKYTLRASDTLVCDKSNLKQYNGDTYSKMKNISIEIDLFLIGDTLLISGTDLRLVLASECHIDDTVGKFNLILKIVAKLKPSLLFPDSDDNPHNSSMLTRKSNKMDGASFVSSKPNEVAYTVQRIRTDDDSAFQSGLDIDDIDDMSYEHEDNEYSALYKALSVDIEQPPSPPDGMLVKASRNVDSRTFEALISGVAQGVAQGVKQGVQESEENKIDPSEKKLRDTKFANHTKDLMEALLLEKPTATIDEELVTSYSTTWRKLLLHLVFKSDDLFTSLSVKNDISTISVSLLNIYLIDAAQTDGFNSDTSTETFTLVDYVHNTSNILKLSDDLKFKVFMYLSGLMKGFIRSNTLTILSDSSTESLLLRLNTSFPAIKWLELFMMKPIRRLSDSIGNKNKIQTNDYSIIIGSFLSEQYSIPIQMLQNIEINMSLAERNPQKTIVTKERSTTPEKEAAKAAEKEAAKAAGRRAGRVGISKV
jgi:hypothetical protein